MSTITRGATTITPTEFSIYRASSEVPTIEHVLLDGSVRYNARTARPRAGTLRLLFLSYATAFTALNALRQTGPFVYTDTDVAQTSMTFVVFGSVQIEQDDTAASWYIEVPFREVP